MTELGAPVSEPRDLARQDRMSLYANMEVMYQKRLARVDNWRATPRAKYLLVHRNTDGSTADVTPPASSGFNVRTRVHEYGGEGHRLIAGIPV